jgi:valyl-tRNA synthetase
MDNYEFNLFNTETYSFIYDDFCSNYIEFSKFNSESKTTKSVLCYVLTGILKMLHPFMPFVTEEIYQMLPIKESESIMISSYPEYNKEFIFKDEEKIVDDQIDFIKKFRNIKTENNMTKDLKILFENSKYNDLVIKTLRLTDNLVNEALSIKSYPVSSNNIKATIYFEKEETNEDIENKQKQIEDLKASIERREKLLSNENYVSKAPANIVEMDRVKLEEEKNKLEELLK